MMSEIYEALSIEQGLRARGELLRPVKGDSMMPLLDQRTDIVKIVPVSGELKPYDLPLYRRPNGSLVMHRILKVRKKHYVICGDNRQVYERVPKEWVIALAVGRYRGDEYLPFDDGDYLSEIEQLCRTRARVFNRLRVAVLRTFPPRIIMKRRYPILNRIPLLLPFCHVARWLCAAVNRIRRKKQ